MEGQITAVGKGYKGNDLLEVMDMFTVLTVVIVSWI
jgi:hypothetical protein